MAVHTVFLHLVAILIAAPPLRRGRGPPRDTVGRRRIARRHHSRSEPARVGPPGRGGAAARRDRHHSAALRGRARNRRPPSAPRRRPRVHGGRRWFRPSLRLRLCPEPLGFRAGATAGALHRGGAHGHEHRRHGPRSGRPRAPREPRGADRARGRGARRHLRRGLPRAALRVRRQRRGEPAGGRARAALRRGLLRARHALGEADLARDPPLRGHERGPRPDPDGRHGAGALLRLAGARRRRAGAARRVRCRPRALAALLPAVRAR